MTMVAAGALVVVGVALLVVFAERAALQREWGEFLAQWKVADE